MARQPNYGQDRAERQRKKAARRDERLAAKAERRDKHRQSDPRVGESAASSSENPAAERPGAPNLADASATQRLAQALAFVCGPDHPATLATARAAQSGTTDDVQQARAAFMQLTAQSQNAALKIAASASRSTA